MELTKYQKIAVKAALFSLVENQVINHEQFDELIPAGRARAHPVHGRRRVG